MNTEFGDNLGSMRVAVVGAGVSGRAVIEALCRYGAAATILDDRALGDIQWAVDSVCALNLTVRSFADGPVAPRLFDLVVVSPGVRPDHTFIVECNLLGIPVISEIELAWRLSPCPMIAVTGTNGKSTVTALIGAMLRAGGRTAHVAGNIKADDIELPLAKAAIEAKPDDIIAAEISSFQLERVDLFRPHVAVITNLGHDHLDRYESVEAYWDAKARIFARQNAEDYAVVRYGDERVASRAGNGTRLWFGDDDAIQNSACVVDGWVVIRRASLSPPYEGGGRGRCSSSEQVVTSHGQDTAERKAPPLVKGGERILPISDIRLPGKHNLLNVLAAAAACMPFNIAAEAIAEAARSFNGLAHRMEYVTTVHGVRYINNSMCTNPEAVYASLAAFDRPVILIAGGHNKDLDLTLLRDAGKHVAAAILIGVSARDVGAQLEAGGVARIEYADSMSAAVNAGARIAREGDVVILAPGCASFDMFDNFEHRGREFRRAALALSDAEPAENHLGRKGSQ